MNRLNDFRAMIARQNFVILDTETTGLEWPSEIVQIAVIDGVSGETLVNSLVRPTGPIPLAASRVHGIVDEMVADAPDWIGKVRPRVCDAIEGRDLVIYNAGYDLKLLDFTDRQHNAEDWGANWWQNLPGWCAMEWYAEYWGAFDDYHRSYTWQKLGTAMVQQGLKVGGRAHGALGDCQMTRELVIRVCEELASQERQQK